MASFDCATNNDSFVIDSFLNAMKFHLALGNKIYWKANFILAVRLGFGVNLVPSAS